MLCVKLVLSVLCSEMLSLLHVSRSQFFATASVTTLALLAACTDPRVR
jgi:hypothetical protein